MTTRYVSALARARGLGAAGHGPGHWWAQRVSAAALVPLVFWLVVTLASGVAAEHAALTAWLSAPLDATLMILLLIAAFHHAALGLQVVAEDHIHSDARFAVVAAVHLACAAGATLGIAAVLLIALTK